MKTTFTFCLLSVFTLPGISQGLTLPYYTGFDNVSEQQGWQQYHTGNVGSSNWGVGAGGYSAPNELEHDYNVGGAATDTVIDWYVSPALDLSLPSAMSLKVMTAGFSTPFVDNCEVWFGTGSQDPAEGVFQLVGNLSYMLPQFQWRDTMFTIPFTSENAYIAIKYKTIGAAWSTYGIDNIKIENTTSVINAFPSQAEVPSLNIFPNPTNGSTTFMFGSFPGIVSVSIRNMSGDEVRSIQNICSNKISVDISSLPTGIYTVSVMQNFATIARERMIVAH